MSSNPLPQEARVGQLEQEVRRLRLVAIAGVLLAGMLAVSAFGWRVQEVVQAERVELLGSGGARHATLSADSAGFVVTLLDATGRPAGSLRLTAEPRVSVETGGGREVAGLGSPRPRNLAE